MNMLIIKPSSLGDIIHALPFLKAVKDKYPVSRVDWVISKDLRGILEGNPLINELIVIDKDTWKSIGRVPCTLKELLALRKTLKDRHYDIAADLQGLLRSGIIAHFTNAPLKIGFEEAREGSRHFYDKRVSTEGISHAVAI
jgi:ADP-heptose:LPS heptosyltransferase